MRQKSNSTPASFETLVRNIRRATRKHHAAEEKIRIVLDGLRGETSPDDNPCHGSILLDTRNAPLRSDEGEDHSGGNRDQHRAKPRFAGTPRR